ncbi:divergent polysaccharide deacetylase family protein [Candidatus Acidulodesulfobacterium sp. H_13]|uniref:divergent polysaccharide deacetylase family protein n=1 Tax=Candidatus Acidulodesulfobacterium sp. H_13 TaxID=3395470 RepID=UPI003AF4667B
MANNKGNKTGYRIKIFLTVSIFLLLLFLSIFIYYGFIFKPAKILSKKYYSERKQFNETALKIKEYKKYPIKAFKIFFKKTLKNLNISKSNIIIQNISLIVKPPVNSGKDLKALHVNFLKFNILISKKTRFDVIEKKLENEFERFVIPSEAPISYYLYDVKNNCLCIYVYDKTKLFLKVLFIVKGLDNSGFESVREYVNSPKIALDIDDIGYDTLYINKLISLHTPITFAIFPYAPYSKEIDLELHKAGYETILHIPMEPVNTLLFPGDGALYIHMNKKEIRRKILTDIGMLPFIDGANNHEGSMFTSDRKKICDAISVFKDKKMFFMDSFTDIDSYAYRCAIEKGLPSARRDVFLDDKPSVGYIKNQIEIATYLADKFKRVIVIGHPRPDTVKVLMREIPKLKKAGYMFVPLCEFLR